VNSGIRTPNIFGITLALMTLMLIFLIGSVALLRFMTLLHFQIFADSLFANIVLGSGDLELLAYCIRG
jgi:high-affinity K+ transport system ATPase subunit B